MCCRLSSGSCQHSLERWLYDPRLRVGILFSFHKMGDRSDKERVCTQGAPLLVTVDWAHSCKGQNFAFWGCCHSTSSWGTQHFWQGIKYFLQAKTCRRLMNIEGKNQAVNTVKRDWFLLVIVSEYWPIQAVVLNIHVICNNCALTWRNFQFQADQKQRQRSRSWIKNETMGKIPFQWSRDENESVSLLHCCHLKEKK